MICLDLMKEIDINLILEEKLSPEWNRKIMSLLMSMAEMIKICISTTIKIVLLRKSHKLSKMSKISDAFEMHHAFGCNGSDAVTNEITFI